MNTYPGRFFLLLATVIMVFAALSCQTGYLDEQAKMKTRDSQITDLTGQVVQRTRTVTDLQQRVADLQDQLSALKAQAAAPSQGQSTTITITKYEKVETFVPRPYPRQFKSGDELRDYLGAKSAYMPAEDQNCVDVSRFFMEDAFRDGYLVSLQYLPDWQGKGPHILNMVLTDDNSLYYVEPQTLEYWWMSPASNIPLASAVRP